MFLCYVNHICVYTFYRCESYMSVKSTKLLTNNNNTIFHVKECCDLSLATHKMPPDMDHFILTSQCDLSLATQKMPLDMDQIVPLFCEIYL